jgi:hypothetical protein
MNRRDTDGVLSSNRRDSGQSVSAETVDGFDVGLDAGTST